MNANGGPDPEWYRELEQEWGDALPKMPSWEYLDNLDFQRKHGATRTERYRVQAELEDIADGHWNGPREDSPPDSWQDTR